jgi:hypothetical protein
MNAQLLEKARNAGASLEAAERAALLARAEYHAAIRRLHLSGVPLRDLADALGLSHQRVQQIVDKAGGSWWSRAWRTRRIPPDAVCTWCGRPPSEVSKLIAGPRVFICDACVAAARAAASGATANSPFAGTSRRGVLGRCAFCGKGPAKNRPLAVAREGRVCRDCLEACHAILDVT